MQGVPALDVPEFKGRSKLLLHHLPGGGSSWLKNLSDDRRHVVTTASLPSITGTAVNLLFQTAHLARSEKQNAMLLDLYICNWLEERIGFKADFRISFYPGKFSKERRSIIPAGDTSQFIPSRDADVAKF
ncbi:hypothetical protein KY285_006001 [Solanum tuberosum]|nr:hypothetical protein KY285_006001 [Solanum tuberosum]